MIGKQIPTLVAIAALMGTVSAVSALPASAASQDELKARVQTMEQQLKELKKQVETNKQTAAEAKKESTSPATRNIKFHLGGYASADYTATDASGSSSQFGAGNFNPIFLINYKDLVSVEGELELTIQSDGETKTALEFGNINFMPTDWLTLTGGRFLSPLGDFQQHQHPDWINKLPDRPAGFVEDGGAEHLSEVGLMARGAVPAGSTTVDYAVFVGNGPRLATDLDEGVKMEGFGTDDNDNKAVGGRIGFRPVPYVNVGLSGMHSQIRGNEGSGGGSPVTTADYNMFDADGAFTMGNWDIRGEYVRAHLDSLSTAVNSSSAPSMIPASTWQAWYGQAAYRLAGVTDNSIAKNLEPVVRYSQFHVSGLSNFKLNEENRWTIGLNYWFTPSAVAKIAYENKDFLNKTDENVFRAQLAFGF